MAKLLEKVLDQNPNDMEEEPPQTKRGVWKDKDAQAAHLRKIREMAASKRAELAAKAQEEVERLKQTKYKRAVVKKIVEDKINEPDIESEPESVEEVVEVVRKSKPNKKKVIKKKIVEISSDSSSSDDEEDIKQTLKQKYRQKYKEKYGNKVEPFDDCVKRNVNNNVDRLAWQSLFPNVQCPY